jgi:uncharacterized membrane protein (DUF485 family)
VLTLALIFSMRNAGSKQCPQPLFFASGSGRKPLLFIFMFSGQSRAPRGAAIRVSPGDQRKHLVRPRLQNKSKCWQHFSAIHTTYPEETHMSDPVVDKIQKHPKYLELRQKRGGFGWMLTIMMMVVYYGYIALIAFNKPFLAQRIGDGVTSLGVPIGMGVIIFTVVITAIYVRRANSEYDDLTAAILKDVSK